MSRPTVEVSISPDVFRWICGSSGWKAGDIARKIDIPEDTIQRWCKGEGSPRLPLGKAEQLATAFKRPLATFLLSRPPSEPGMPRDFRKILNPSQGYSKETYLVIRKARRLQQIRRELLENLQMDPRVKIQPRTPIQDPEVVAREERVGIPVEETDTELTPTKLFDIWREWFEKKNIAVFQMKMPMEDARGFSLTDAEPYVIVVNEMDTASGRLFTLFHEYGHILLNEPAVCNMDSDEVQDTKISGVERWCNRFAGAFLVPEEILEKDTTIIKYIQTSNFSRAAGSISSRFKISKESAFMRLLTLDYISTRIFRRERERTRAEDAIKAAQRKESQRRKELEEERGFGVPLDRKCLTEKGRPFISLVVKNEDLGFISSNDALDYLDIKLKHLEKLRA
jgi:Zn-dependent peptidase ImmA (M78 family)